jgi:hypothetical protein
MECRPAYAALLQTSMRFTMSTNISIRPVSEPRAIIPQSRHPRLAQLGKILAVLVAFLILAFIIFQAVVRPWYGRWGAMQAEVSMTLPGDELVPAADSQSTRAITINAPASEIYPWLVQLGWERGGLYSYAWLENLVGLQFVNADRIHPEWQNTQVGDFVGMGPPGKSPPPYIVAQLLPNRAVLLGHRGDDGARWVETWQFVLNPIDANTTRLVVRTRSNMTDPAMRALFGVVEPFAFVMERGMLHGIKERVEE